MNDEDEKRCRKCGESFPATPEFFYRQAREKDGLRAICKGCYSELPSVRRRTEHPSPTAGAQP